MSDYVWLNKNSRQFLERDYLLPGQTVDERVNVICEEAGKLLKDKKFASKFKDYIQKGYYSLSTPVWTNFGTNRGLPISCITGNMPVNVKTGDLFGFKKASQIVIGDLLLTHLGNYKPVSNIIVTPKHNDIYHLKVYSNDLTIHITGNHLIYTPQGWTRCENLRVGIDLVGTMENGRLHYWPIESLVLSEDVETVYDFTVEDDHSFCVSDLIVHNCYGSHIEDSMEAILDAHSEIGMMTKFGGGTSAYFGDLRGRGASIHNNGSSSGAVHFISMFENLINIVSQGNTRRGNFAAYLPVTHPDIDEFLDIRSDGHPIQNIFPAVTVPNDWMEGMRDGDRKKRIIWAKILKSRIETGVPYVMFSDNVNNNKPDVYKDKNMSITHSNLCSEIALADNDSESFVCDLSSMNIYHYDEWKNTDAVETMIYFLDAVMTEFIEKSKILPHMERAYKFALNQRALGLGWLGWHSYLQSKMIPFESMEAKFLNSEVAKCIQEKSLKASKELAIKFGEPELLKGYGRRNVTLTAIAPTKSSAFIIGQVSEGIEPQRSNYYVKDTAKGKFTIKNKELEKLLKIKGKNTVEVWTQILHDSGSVRNLDFLSESEKDVFKTFSEISMKEVVIQAATRQKFIDQSQSLNILIHPATSTKDLNALMMFAWENGIKTMYYQHSMNAAQELGRNILECRSCSA